MENLLLQEFEPVLYGPFGEIATKSEKDTLLFAKALAEFRGRLGKKKAGIQLVRSIYSLMEKLAEKFLARNEVACKPGCSFCCLQMVCCTNLEMQLIVTWLRMKPRDFFSNVMQSAREKATQMKRELEKLMREKRPSDWKEIEGDLRLKHLMKSCPFFDENIMRCSIYPVRPVDCRAAYVIGQPCGTSDWARSRFPKTYYAQAASDIVTEENTRIFDQQSLPLFEWVYHPDFAQNF